MSTRENLQRLMTQAGENPNSLSKKTGVSQPTILRILTGESAEPSQKTVLPLAKFFNISPDQLRGDAPSKKLASYNVVLEHEPGPDFVAIERVNLRVSAGVTGFAVEHLEGNRPPIFFRADWLAQSGYKATNLFALKVIGDSMEPGLWEGDLIVMNQADTTLRDGHVFVFNYEGELVIKRLVRDRGQWLLHSDNQYYKPKLCDEHALVIGRVIYKQSGHI